VSLCPIYNNFDELMTDFKRRDSERDHLISEMKDEVQFNQTSEKKIACDGRNHFALYPDGRLSVLAKRDPLGKSPKLITCPDFGATEEENVKRIQMNDFLESVPMTMRGKEIDQLDGLHPEKEKALSFVEGKYRIMVLRGDTGRGKTHLAISIGKEFVRSGMTAFFITGSGEAEGIYWVFKELSNRQAATEGIDLSARDIWIKMKHSDCVIVDDLGGDRESSWGVVESGLMELLDKAQGKIIFTTNLPSAEIGKRYGDRIRSRIFDDSVSVTLMGKDHRGGKHG
jgi:DNA replication protein DnaC